MFHYRLLFLLLSAVLVSPVIADTPAGESQRPWEFLSTTSIGAAEFLEAHPEWDGRGVVIAVLDTGVEPGLAGLATTSAGEPKIVDFRDFTGQGDVEISPAIRDSDAEGEAVHGPEGPWLRGLEDLDPAPDPGKVMIGYLRERDLVNSDAQDLNGNGRTDDIYGVVVYETGGMDGTSRRIVVDTDADHRLDDEEVRADFLEDNRFFTVGGAGRREGVPAVSLALNLWEEDEDKVTFVFDDGAHGTHVSGIAAGYRIGGQDGHNGIAPGAQLLSLKLGDNTLSGGASVVGSMWKAWRYAAEYGREHGVPVVIQMSYGVGSEIEGQSVMEKEIDRVLDANEMLVGCVSNGNAGPGLSSSGLPSCSKRVIASGALLNRTTAADVYGADLPHDFMFAFSSRGAETAKPDLVAPGFAASTIPVYRKGRDVMAGTSMASPQTAGAAALIISAALAEDLPVVGAWVKAALRRGALPVPDATVLDQGAGRIDVPRAWEIYRVLASRKGPEPLDWEIETESPEMPSGKGPAAHWRGIEPPSPPDKQAVKVTPRFRRKVTEQERTDFYRAFDLVSTAPWVRADRRSVYSRSSSPISFGLVYDRGAFSKPGLYAARLLAFDKSLSRSDREKLGPDWDLAVSVVVPHTAAPGETSSFPEARLAPAAIRRYPVRVPVGATGMEVRLELPEGTRRRVQAAIHDPEGRRVVRRRAGGDGGPVLTYRIAGRDLLPGVWEIVLLGERNNAGEAQAELSVRFDALSVQAGAVHLDVEEGGASTGEIALTNRANTTFHGKVHTAITGYRVVEEKELDRSVFRMPLRLGPEIGRIDLRISMDGETWGRFTDLAVRILDDEDRAVLSSGMGNAILKTGMDNPSAGDDPAEYTLEITGGLADPDDDDGYDLLIERTYRYAEPVAAEVANGKNGAVTFYPDRASNLSLELRRTPPALPPSAKWILELEISDARDGRKAAGLEVEVAP